MLTRTRYFLTSKLIKHENISHLLKLNNAHKDKLIGKGIFTKGARDEVQW